MPEGKRKGKERKRKERAKRKQRSNPHKPINQNQKP
jgi:hypothetical protein